MFYKKYEPGRNTLQNLGCDAMRCDAMQGYLASRPLHGASLQTWLEQLAIQATCQATQIAAPATERFS
jgi:hypothetical protein